jgi:RNA polymerase sigma-70 factor (ECF subfamily)
LNEVIEATVADSADNAEVAPEKKHEGEILRAASSKLSPEHREIIDLVYYHENSADDAADILSIPRATVKTRMFYARKKLAELIQAA